MINTSFNNLQGQLDLKAPLLNPTWTVGGLSKEIVNLANVDNTSDLNKPISNATQTTLSDLIVYLQTLHYNRDEINGILAELRSR